MFFICVTFLYIMFLFEIIHLCTKDKEKTINELLKKIKEQEQDIMFWKGLFNYYKNTTNYFYGKKTETKGNNRKQ